MKEPKLIRLRDMPELKESAVRWFHEKWSVPESAYRESTEESLVTEAAFPRWYLALSGDRIVGGCGVIANDFHPRTDLTPNVCAVYVEPEFRRKGIAGKILGFCAKDMAEEGIPTLYLLTDHTGFYERYGWEYLCPVTGFGEEAPSRMYVLRTEKESIG